MSTARWIGIGTLALVPVSLVVEALRKKPKRPTTLAWAPAIPIRYADIGGVQARYIKTGSGPTLVLLHTLRTQLDIFQKVIPQLAKDFTVYAVDYPGHGWSDIPRADYTPEFFRRFVTDQTVIATQPQVIENMARNVALVAIGPPVRGLMAPYEKAGLKLDLLTFGTGPNVAVLSAGGSGVYVYNRRPHPAATRVFVNWLLSRDVQYQLAKVLDQRSRRQDVPETADAESIPEKGVK